MDKIKKSSSLKGYTTVDNISFFVLLVVLFFLPIFFLPFLQISLLSGKGFLVFIGVAISFFFWLLARLMEGKISFPKQKLLTIALSIPVILLVSSLFSPSFRGSMGGDAFEITTVVGSIILFLILFLSSVYFQNKQRIFLALGSIGASFALVSIFTILDLFLHISSKFSKVFVEINGGTLLGSWNDMALFAGFVTVLSIVSIEMLPLAIKRRWTLYTLLTLSLFFLAISNFLTAWLMVGIFSLFIFIYSLSFLKEEKNTVIRFPTASFVTVLVCLLFILANNFFGAFLSKKLNIDSSVVRPSVYSTYGVAKSIFIKKAVIGVGPNRFPQAWDFYKSADINNTKFWNASFVGGFGWIPSFAVTTGVIGFLAWLSLLVIFLCKGFKSMFVSTIDRSATFIFVSSFLCATYLWIASVLYFTNITSVALAFLMSGLCIGSWSIKKDKNISISFMSEPRMSFFSLIAFVVLMIGVVSGGYFFIEKFASIIYFEKAIYGQTGSQNLIVDNAEMNMIKAIELYPTDMYYRSLSQVYIGKFNNLIGQKELSSEALKPELQSLVANAENSGMMAVKIDGKNYLNWIALAQVYQSFISAGIQGSYDSTVSSYEKAIALNPKNPSIYFSLAKVELSQKNIDKAKTYVASANTLKPDYIDGLVLLGQYYENIGNPIEALNYYKQATIVSVSSAPAFFNLGYFYYKNGNYIDAVGDFERAVILDPINIQYRYYLGLSYNKVGQKDRALAQLEYLLVLNPGNKEIQTMISNIQAGISDTPTASVQTVTAPETKTITVKKK